MGNNTAPKFIKLRDLKSENFTEFALDECTLKILINKKRLCFCILNVKQHIIALVDYANNSESQPFFTNNDFLHLFETDALLQENYEKVLIGYQSNYHCITASDLVNEQSIKDTYELCVPKLPYNAPYVIEQYKLNDDYQILFGLPKDLEQLLCDKLKNDFSIVTAFGAFANSIITENSIFSTRKMYINLFENNIDLFITNASKLQFANSFSYIPESVSDFLYNIISAGQLYDFKFEEEPVIISGFYDNESDHYNRLMDYAHRQELIQEPSSIVLSPELYNISNHHYYNLYCL